MELIGEEALDIADYLKSEQGDHPDIHDDKTQRQGRAALILAAIGVV